MDIRGWSRSETHCLVSIWAEDSVQRKLQGTYRNRSVYEEISRKMEEKGFSRSWRQCQRKVKHLKTPYNKAKKTQSDRDRIRCPFYEELDRVLGDRPSFLWPGEGDGSDWKLESTEDEEPVLNSTVHTVVVKVSEPEQNLCDDHPDAPSPSPSSEMSASSAQSPTSSRKRPSSSGTRPKEKRSRLDSEAVRSSRSHEEVLLKMQKAQHEHEERLFGMMLQSVAALVSTITSTQPPAAPSQAWFQRNTPPAATATGPEQQQEAGPSDENNNPSFTEMF